MTINLSYLVNSLAPLTVFIQPFLQNFRFPSTARGGGAITDFSVAFVWKKGVKEISKGQNISHLFLEITCGRYTSTVIGICCIFESLPHGVTVNSK